MTLLDDPGPPARAVALNDARQWFELADEAHSALAAGDLEALHDLVPRLSAALISAAAPGPAPDPHTVTADLLRDVLEGRRGIEPLAGHLGRPGGSWFLTVLTGATSAPAPAPGMVAAVAGMLRSGAAATPLGGDIVVIAPYTGVEDALRLAERMRARFATRLDRGLVGCVSEAFTAPVTGTPPDLAVLCRTLRRAASLFAIGTRADPAGPKLATAAQLRPQLVLAELAEFAGGSPTLDAGPLPILREHDAARGTDFLGSLLAYFDAGCDVTEAAKRLHVHRNTLRYRLQRIEELAATSLGVPLERFTLELQVRLHFVSATN